MERLRLEQGRDFELCNPEDYPLHSDYWRLYHSLMERDGVSPDAARTILRTNTTAIAAVMLKRGEADAMICGTYGQYDWHLRYVLNVIGKKAGVRDVSALSALVLPKGAFFITDTHVTPDPSVEELVETTLMAAKVVHNFGMIPKVALLSHSQFGTASTESARKMRETVKRLRQLAPELEVEGEMHADVAIDEELRARIFPNSHLQGMANLLVLPNLDAANAAFNLVKILGDGLPVGPMLLGAAQPAHVVTPSVTGRGIVNISALAVVHAQLADEGVGMA